MKNHVAETDYGHRGMLRFMGILAMMVSALVVSGQAEAVRWHIGEDLIINLDTNIQYTLGMRTDSRNELIANNPVTDQGNFLFDRGDVVTNRIQGLFEFESRFRGASGIRVTGAAWKEFAFDRDDVSQNPAFPEAISVYPDGRFSSRTSKFHIEGAELLDAFVFTQFDVGDIGISGRVGRFSQQWGNALFHGFAAISYSQQPTDFIKGFTQPGSDVRELFRPRRQVSMTAQLSRDLAVTGQYYFEFQSNLFPEGGTYLAPANILFEGPVTGGPVQSVLGEPIEGGRAFEPDNNNKNWGIKMDWSPQWLPGDVQLVYRRYDEVQPWTMIELFVCDDSIGLPVVCPEGARDGINLTYAENVQMYGIAYETNIDTPWRQIGAGLELSYRRNAGLMNSATRPGPAPVGLTFGEYRAQDGPRGNLINAIANGIVFMPANRLWNSATWIAEFAYTRLDSVTRNEEVFLREGSPVCVDSVNPEQPGSKADGCATRNSLSVAALFEPEWLQVRPAIDLRLPIFVQYGIRGNPANTAGSFFAQDSLVYSIGMELDFHRRHQVRLQYQDYYWRPRSPAVENPFGLPQYPGGNGPFALNDKGWISLSFKTSF
jgi:hypothetical protein